MSAKILVADDSITIQKIVAMAFENEDAEVQGVGNGREAFARIAEFQPDIVLADVDMPGLNGFDLSRKIKETPEYSSISVLLLASDFEEFDEKRFQQSGADSHISKPFKSDDIVLKVKELLSGPRETLVQPDFSDEKMEEEQEDFLALSEDDLIQEPEGDKTDLELEDTVLELTENDLQKNPDLDPLLEDEELEGEELSTDYLIEMETQEPDVSLDDDFLKDLETEEMPVSEESLTSDVSSKNTQTKTSEESDKVEQKDSVETIEELMDEEESDDTLDELLENMEQFVHSNGASDSDEREQKESDSRSPASTSSEEKTLPTDTIDEVIKEVHALKGYSSFIEEENRSDEVAELDNSEPVSEVSEEIGVTDTLETSQETEQSVEPGKMSSTLSEKEKEEVTALEPSDNGISNETAKLRRPMENEKDDEIIEPEPEDLLGNLAIPSLALTSLEDSGLNSKRDNSFPKASPVENLPANDVRTEQEEDFETSERNEMEKSESDSKPTKTFPDSGELNEELRKMLEESLETSVRREIAGLSGTIIQSVKDVVREITPGIARALIQEEIERIRKNG